MPIFTLINGATVVIKTGGVYKQVEVAVYRGYLFAKFGSGYVMLHKESFGGNGTSKVGTSWESLEGVKYKTEVGTTALIYLEAS